MLEVLMHKAPLERTDKIDLKIFNNVIFNTFLCKQSLLIKSWDVYSTIKYYAGYSNYQLNGILMFSISK